MPRSWRPLHPWADTNEMAQAERSQKFQILTRESLLRGARVCPPGGGAILLFSPTSISLLYTLPQAGFELLKHGLIRGLNDRLGLYPSHGKYSQLLGYMHFRKAELHFGRDILHCHFISHAHIKLRICVAGTLGRWGKKRDGFWEFSALLIQ